MLKDGDAERIIFWHAAFYKWAIKRALRDYVLHGDLNLLQNDALRDRLMMRARGEA